MASDERDRNFDKAIARHLRSAASGDAANKPANSFPRRDACPDAETLAAYHERSLLPAEQNSWKEHIVGCAPCQELLAHLEATDDIPLHRAEEAEALRSMETRHAAARRSMEPLPLAEARGQNQSAADTQPERARARRRSGGARWRWLAPAGAIAAGLLFFIATHENQGPPLPSSDEIKIAKNPPSEPPLATRVPPAKPREQVTLPQSPSVTDQTASSSARAESGATMQRQRADVGAREVPARPSARNKSTVQTDAERALSADRVLEENKQDLDAKTASDALLEKAEVQAQANGVQSQNQYNAPSPKVAGPAALGQVANTKKMKAPAPEPPPSAPALGVVGGSSVGAATETIIVTDKNLITAPGASLQWRTGRAGLIEFSQDGGHSWSRQPSGVLVDLLTGFAPEEKVCWIVGRVGAILLTTDGGEHWKLISSPLKEDLGGIQATDALHATIWNRSGTKAFTTSNGGLSWERVRKE